MRLSSALCFLTIAASSVLRADVVAINNSGFESGNLTQVGNGTFSQLVPGSSIFAAGGTLDNWTVAFSTTASAAGGFDPSAGGVNWTTKWWDGNNIAYLQIGAAGTVSLSQTLTATLLDNSTYTLSALIGRREFTPNFNYAIQLYAGTTLLDSASNVSLASNSSGSDSFVYSSGASNALAGQNLKIVLSSASTGAFTEAFFDDVALSVSTPNAVPEPGTLWPLLTLTAFVACIQTTRLRRKASR
jgi:hypothetical protein